MMKMIQYLCVLSSLNTLKSSHWMNSDKSFIKISSEFSYFNMNIIFVNAMYISCFFYLFSTWSIWFFRQNINSFSNFMKTRMNSWVNIILWALTKKIIAKKWSEWSDSQWADFMKSKILLNSSIMLLYFRNDCIHIKNLMYKKNCWRIFDLASTTRWYWSCFTLKFLSAILLYQYLAISTQTSQSWKWIFSTVI